MTKTTVYQRALTRLFAKLNANSEAYKDTPRPTTNSRQVVRRQELKTRKMVKAAIKAELIKNHRRGKKIEIAQGN